MSIKVQKNLTSGNTKILSPGSVPYIALKCTTKWWLKATGIYSYPIP
jgi:hypothetical protein